MEWVIESYKDAEIPMSSNLITKVWTEYEPITRTMSPDFIGFLWTIPGVDPDLLLCAKLGGKIVGQVFTLPRTVNLKDRTSGWRSYTPCCTSRFQEKRNSQIPDG